MASISLTESELRVAARQLAVRDPSLQQILTTHGPPPMWDRKPGFPTLIHIILEQQVSLASAAAIYRRLQNGINPFKPARFVELGTSHLRTLGLTRQKAEYCVHLAQAIVDKRLNLSTVARMDDDQARAALLELKGVGSWSASIYLLMALRRSDIWPAGDLALAVILKQLLDLDHVPGSVETTAIAERWRPFRSVAARMLWQEYLAQRKPPVG